VRDPGRFDELLRLWQDGEAQPSDLKELGEALRDSAERRKELVRSVLLEVNLYCRYAASAGTKATRPKTRTRFWEAAAAALVLAISAFLVARLFLLPKPAPNVVKEAPKPELPRFATPAAESYSRLLQRATLTLSQAVTRALEGREGVPIKAELEEEKGIVQYSVALAVGKVQKEVEIDAASGQVLDVQNEDDDDSALVAAMKIRLGEAIEKALRAVPGRAVEADVEREGGLVRIEVKIVTDRDLREVRIDPATGEVLNK
jgi:uncharacterized membrane protein YkoI